eukprot:361365-Chlamydomonas_euryale.AAC.5
MHTIRMRPASQRPTLPMPHTLRCDVMAPSGVCSVRVVSTSDRRTSPRLSSRAAADSASADSPGATTLASCSSSRSLKDTLLRWRMAATTCVTE